MVGRKLPLMILGLLILIAGTIFALQGANLVGGSSLMNGDPTWIYVGSVLGIVGLVLVALALHSRSRPPAPAAGPGPAKA
jgi:hypothetical protein